MKQLVNVSSTSSLMEMASALTESKNCGDILELPLGDWETRTVEGQLRTTVSNSLSSKLHSIRNLVIDQQILKDIRQSVTELLSASPNVAESSVNVYLSTDVPNTIIVDTEVRYTHQVQRGTFKVTI